MAFYAIDGIVPVVDPTSFVHPTASVIGDVIIGPGCYVGPGASLRGDFGRLVMAGGGNLQDGCIVHGFPDTDTLLDIDAHIGHGESAFVAAMAFIKAGFEVPDRHLAAGIPAKVLRPLTDQEIAWKEEGTREYQQLTRRCLASFKEVEPLRAMEPNRPRVSVGTAIPLYKVKGAG
jgi:phenylacetic acid degradation protein